MNETTTHCKILLLNIIIIILLLQTNHTTH
jgi:hypothetical protein